MTQAVMSRPVARIPRREISIEREASIGRPRGRDGAHHPGQVWACVHCYELLPKNKKGMVWKVIQTVRGPKRHLVPKGPTYGQFTACGGSMKFVGGY